jgi:hypothetical protein
VFDIRRSSNVTVQGVVISNAYRHVYIQSSTQVMLRDSTVGWVPTDIGIGGKHALQITSSSSLCTVSNCVFRNYGRVNPTTQNDEGDTIRTGLNNDSADVEGWGHRFLDSTFVGGGHEVLAIFSRSNIVRNCTIYNDNWMPNPVIGGLNGNRCIELLGRQSYGSLIENCRIGYSGNPSDGPDYVNLVEVAGGQHIIRNNALYSSRGAGIAIYYKSQSKTNRASQNRIYHNTIYRTGTDPTIRSDSRDGVRFVHSYESNNVILNNLFWEIAGTPVGYASGNSAAKQIRVAGNHTGTSDPLFVDGVTPGQDVYDRPDLRLSSGSPCIDAGLWLTTISSASGSGNSFAVADARYFFDGWGIPGEQGDLIQLEGQPEGVRILSVDGNIIMVDRPLIWTNGQGVALAYRGRAPDVGAYEYAPAVGLTNPAISVSPLHVDFGSVVVGSTNDHVLTVRNTGGGTLAGTASVSAPFSIVGSSSFSLGSNAFVLVTVRYEPTATGDHTQTLRLTGGGGASALLDGSATPTGGGSP